MWSVDGSDSSGLDLKAQKRSHSLSWACPESFPGPWEYMPRAPRREAAAKGRLLGDVKWAGHLWPSLPYWATTLTPVPSLVSSWDALGPLLPATCCLSSSGVSHWEEDWPGQLEVVAKFPEPRSGHMFWQGLGYLGWGSL